MPNRTDRLSSCGHGSLEMPRVVVSSYNLELRSDDGFLGDDASETAFRQLVEDWREKLAPTHRDPLGPVSAENMRRDELDDCLHSADPAAAKIVQAAVDQFSQDVARVLRRFLQTKGWTGVERIVCGGGLQTSRVGQRVIALTNEILNTSTQAVTLSTLSHDPDEGGLIGWAHVAPLSVLDGQDAFLAADIGGTNIRCGVVVLDRSEAGEPADASVAHLNTWRHADEEPNREQTIEQLVSMLLEAAEKATVSRGRLAPFIGISCPGVILSDGRIDRGVQNLPGDWTEDDFHLPTRIRDAIPKIGAASIVMMHNDAVVQGLSELPRMQKVNRWAAVTIGTGLGNCSFVNRP